MLAFLDNAIARNLFLTNSFAQHSLHRSLRLENNSARIVLAVVGLVDSAIAQNPFVTNNFAQHGLHGRL